MTYQLFARPPPKRGISSQPRLIEPYKSEKQRRKAMLINYKDADGRIIQLEVTEEIGNFYLASMEAEKSNDRRNTRRHTSLSEFVYEDARYFLTVASTSAARLWKQKLSGAFWRR